MAASCAVLLLMGGCCWLLRTDVAPPAGESSPVLPLAIDPATNGLTEADRRVYYHADEGIQYVPVDLILSLDRPLSNKRASSASPGTYDEPFFAKPERFGLYPDIVGKGELPIGITRSTDAGYLPMAGINCATCHTVVIADAQAKRALLVDGAPSPFAIDRFLGELIFSMLTTIVNDCQMEKVWDRFESRRKGASGAETSADVEAIAEEVGASDELAAVKSIVETSQVVELERGDLRDAVRALAVKTEETDKKHPAPPPAARAAGAPRPKLANGAYPTAADVASKAGLRHYMIQRVAWLFAEATLAPSGADAGLGRSNPWGVTKNVLASRYLHSSFKQKEIGGPISTPYIWGLGRYRDIFWTGVTNSLLERNMAQGIALLADFNFDPQSFDTTLSIEKLHGVVTYAKKAQPPAWPVSVLGRIDPPKAALGERLFKEQCLDCHSPWQTGPGEAETVLKYCEVGTDKKYFDAQLEQMAPGKDLFAGVLAPFMRDVKRRAYQVEGLVGKEGTYEGGRTNVVWRAPPKNAFVAKPLSGVWASAPYLHNGTVPSIRDLLTDAKARPLRFVVGHPAYDPTRLGFAGATTYYSFTVDTGPSAPQGNSNMGHEYGTNLSADEKDAMIEFLKSYGNDVAASDCTTDECRAKCVPRAP